MKNFKLDTKKSWLWLFDIHMPFHHKKNLACALKWAKEQKLDNLLLGGDIFDFLGVSSFPREDRTPLFKEVKKSMKEFNALISNFKSVVYISGNHELRARRYLIKNSPELMEFLNTTAEATEFILTKCGMVHKDITFVDCLQGGEFLPVKFNKLNIFHGHEFRVGGQVDLCRKIFNHVYDHCLFGHWHRFEKILRCKLGKKMYMVECAGTFQDKSFMPHNHWACSFGSLKVFKKTNFKIETHFAIKGELY